MKKTPINWCFSQFSLPCWWLVSCLIVWNFVFSFYLVLFFIGGAFTFLREVTILWPNEMIDNRPSCKSFFSFQLSIIIVHVCRLSWTPCKDIKFEGQGSIPSDGMITWEYFLCKPISFNTFKRPNLRKCQEWRITLVTRKPHLAWFYARWYSAYTRLLYEMRFNPCSRGDFMRSDKRATNVVFHSLIFRVFWVFQSSIWPQVGWISPCKNYFCILHG